MCVRNATLPIGMAKSFLCPENAMGKRIVITKAGKGSLSLCEVKVFGHKSNIKEYNGICNYFYTFAYIIKYVII